MQKLKLQSFGHLMRRSDSLEKSLMLGKIEGRRRRRRQRMRYLDGITLVMDREVWLAAVHGVEKSRIRLSDWTELNWYGTTCVWNLEATTKYIDAEGRLMVTRKRWWGGVGWGGRGMGQKETRKEEERGRDGRREREKEGERKEGDRYSVDSRGAGKHSWEP